MDAWLWILFGGYVIVWFILFFIPTIMHKKKPTYFKTFVISHRGGAGEGVENTLGAFQNSLNVGVNMIELDVRMTRDHRVVVVHDTDLSHICTFPAIVQNTNYEDLPLYQYKIPITFTKSRAVFMVEKYADRHLPLLSEVLDRFPGMPINIDIKQDSHLLIKKVSEMIKERKRETITVWGSFSDSTASKCYKENPKISIMCSLYRVIFLTVSFYLGFLPFLPIKEQYYELPMLHAPSIKSTLLPTGIKGTIYRIFLEIFSFLLLNPLYLWHLRARGIKVFLWVLNDEEEFKSAVSLGIDGIMTDYPSKLIRYANESLSFRTSCCNFEKHSSQNTNFLIDDSFSTKEINHSYIQNDVTKLKVKVTSQAGRNVSIESVDSYSSENNENFIALRNRGFQKQLLSKHAFKVEISTKG